MLMATLVKISLTLVPVQEPWIKITAPGYHYQGQLKHTSVFDIEFETEEPHHDLVVEHYNKSDLDPTTAVIVESVSFFGITDPRIAWQGVYCPSYPDHYSDKVPLRPAHTYLGWNGVYRLEFDVPVFAWLHRALDLGWLYD